MLVRKKWWKFRWHCHWNVETLNEFAVRQSFIPEVQCDNVVARQSLPACCRQTRMIDRPAAYLTGPLLWLRNHDLQRGADQTHSQYVIALSCWPNSARTLQLLCHCDILRYLKTLKEIRTFSCTFHPIQIFMRFRLKSNINFDISADNLVRWMLATSGRELFGVKILHCNPTLEIWLAASEAWSG